VNFASAVGGKLHASRSWLPSIASRAELFAIVGCVSAVNAFAGKIATAIYSQSLITAILDLGGVSAIVWFAIGTLFAISAEASGSSDAPGKPAMQPADKAVACLTMFLSFAPLNFAAAIGLLLCGTYLAVASARGSADRRIAIVMIALTGPVIWGRFLLALMGPFLLNLDAGMAGLLAGVPVEGNVVSLRGESDVLYVALGCSSVHNMSLAILLFVTLTQFLRLRYTPLLLMTGAGAALAMATVNVLRLATLARFPQYFELVHTGWGGTVFGTISFVAAGAVIAWGIHAEMAH